MNQRANERKEYEETRQQNIEEYCTFFEVVTHEILFLRGLYPDTIFERRRKYETIVHMSRHPELNFYIHESFHRVKPLLLEGSIKKIVVCFKDAKEIPFENYSFMFTRQSREEPTIKHLQREFRAILIKMMAIEKPKKKLSSKHSFQILVYCNSTAENTTSKTATSITTSSNLDELINKGEFLTVGEREGSISMNCSNIEEPFGEHIKTILQKTEYEMVISHQMKRERN